MKKNIKRNPIKRCTLEITSFEGISPGAKHYYGALHYHYVDVEGYSQYKKVELKKKLTKAEAIDLSTDDYRWKAGQYSQRFDDINKVRKLAIKTWKTHFPDADVLLEGYSATADPQECLDGPPILKKKINDYYKKSQKIGWYEGNNEAMTKLSDDYMNNVLRDKTA